MRKALATGRRRGAVQRVARYTCEHSGRREIQARLEYGDTTSNASKPLADLHSLRDVAFLRLRTVANDVAAISDELVINVGLRAAIYVPERDVPQKGGMTEKDEPYRIPFKAAGQLMII